jgi:hypothetical protein
VAENLVVRLASQLRAEDFKVEPDREIAGEAAVVGRRSEFRMEWVGTRLHTFVIAFSRPVTDVERAQELAAAAQQFAIKHKGGLPRGLQTGTATIAVFTSEQPGTSLKDWLRLSLTTDSRRCCSRSSLISATTGDLAGQQEHRGAADPVARRPRG